MDDKRTTELSDEVLDRVAGGASMGLGGDLSRFNTYGPSGPAVAGPGAGQSATTGDIGSGAFTRCDVQPSDLTIEYQMQRAGTYEQYCWDLVEYKRQHSEWEQKRAPGDGMSIIERRALAGPEPVPPDPYDYI